MCFGIVHLYMWITLCLMHNIEDLSSLNLHIKQCNDLPVTFIFLSSLSSNSFCLPACIIPLLLACIYIKQWSQGGSVLQSSSNPDWLPFMEFLALTFCMLFFFVFLFARNHPQIYLIPSLKGPFDRHHSTASELQWPLSAKASCRSRKLAETLFLEATNCFPEGLNSICVLWGLKNKYCKSNTGWGLFSIDGLGRNPSFARSLFALHLSVSSPKIPHCVCTWGTWV